MADQTKDAAAQAAQVKPVDAAPTPPAPEKAATDTPAPPAAQTLADKLAAVASAKTPEERRELMLSAGKEIAASKSIEPLMNELLTGKPATQIGAIIVLFVPDVWNLYGSSDAWRGYVAACLGKLLKSDDLGVYGDAAQAIQYLLVWGITPDYKTKVKESAADPDVIKKAVGPRAISLMLLTGQLAR